VRRLLTAIYTVVNIKHNTEVTSIIAFLCSSYFNPSIKQCTHIMDDNLEVTS